MKISNLLKKTLFILLLTGMSLAWGCTPASGSATAQIYALDTVIDITAYGNKSTEAVNAAKAEIRRLEGLMSVTDEDSDIYRINHADGEAVAVNEESYELIKSSLEISMLTEGTFDITIYNAVKLWGFTTGEYKVPSDEEIAETLSTVGYEKITLSGDNTVAVEADTQLDLGAVAKGYIADKAAEAMSDAGVEYGIISLGGNVRTVGEKPQGESFIIGIRHPEDNEHFVEVSTMDGSVITSGGYQRNFTEDGVTYHHIIDPDTGKPSESNAVSVSIIGNDGALCDALSTAIYIGGTEYAEKLHAVKDDFEYVILTKNNEVYASAGLEGKLTLVKEYQDLQVNYR